MGTKNKKKLLSDSDYLFTLLVALTKQRGGTLYISEEEVMGVSRHETLALFYDTNTKGITLKMIDLALKKDDSIN